MNSAPGRGAAVARNALSGSGRYVVTALLALAVTPYALRVLGPDRFGAWVLAGTVLVTVRTFDLGLERALVRAVAEADGAGEKASARTTLLVGRRVLLGTSFAIATAVVLARHGIVERVLDIPEVLRAEASYAIAGTAIVAVMDAWFRPLSAALDGVGRMDRSRAIDTVQRILSSLGVVLVLGAGYGLPGLVWKNGATALIAGVLYMRELGRTAPELAGPRFGASGRLRPGESRAAARSLLSFGGHVQAVGVSALAYDLWAKVVLGRVAGLGGVAIYDLGSRVVTLLAGALYAAVEAVFPEASLLQSHDPETALAQLHARAGRAVSWMALPMFGLLSVLAVPFATAWLGTEYASVGAVIQVLAIGWLIAIIAAPAYLIAQAGGRAVDSTRAAVVTALVAIVLSTALAGRYGALGVAAAVSTGLGVGGLLMLWQFAKGFGVGWRVSLIVDPRAVASTVVAVAAAWAFIALLPMLTWIPWSLTQSLFGVLVAGFFGLAIYVGSMLLLGVIGEDERRIAREVIAGLRG